MATDPTINGQTLSTGGQNTVFDAPRARISMSALPSVNGAFVQRFGLGPQVINGTGSISAASHAAIKAAIRTIQNAANHTPGDYVDTDNVTHTNCILLEFRQVGDTQREAADSYWVRVSWTILKQLAT